MNIIGLDSGSVSVKVVLLDASGGVLHRQYKNHRGHPLPVALEILKALAGRDDCLLAVTGSAGKLIAEILGIKPLNEIVAQAYATKKLHPHIKTIIEMGVEDSKLILLDGEGMKELFHEFRLCRGYRLFSRSAGGAPPARHRGVQRALAPVPETNIIADNRVNRNVPLEMSVMAVGYLQDGRIFHLLPPRPPLSLDVIYLCTPQEVLLFTSSGRFGYFRHILRDENIPPGEVLAAHILEVKQRIKNEKWVDEAIQVLIAVLRDDYPALMAVLGALGEVVDKQLNRSG